MRRDEIYTASNLMGRVQTKTSQRVAMVTSYKEQIMLQVEFPKFDRPRGPDIGRSSGADHDELSTSDTNKGGGSEDGMFPI